MEEPAHLLRSAELLSSQTLPGGYSRLLLRGPQSLAIPRPGHFVSGRLSQKSPAVCLPVMGVDDGVLECLYRHRNVTDFPGNPEQLIVTLEGNGWNLTSNVSHVVFLARNEGLACVIHAANRLRLDHPHKILTAFLEFDGDPPFTPKPSQILLPGAPAEALACVPLLEDWGVASRLTHSDERRIPKAGWFSGTAVGLAETWLERTAGENHQLACCGSSGFVEAVLNLAARWRLPVETTVLPELIQQ